eukprot:SAG22_NODE_6082_length_902_cov_1.189290_1_plen_150_part_01
MRGCKPAGLALALVLVFAPLVHGRELGAAGGAEQDQPAGESDGVQLGGGHGQGGPASEHLMAAAAEADTDSDGTTSSEDPAVDLLDGGAAHPISEGISAARHVASWITAQVSGIVDWPCRTDEDCSLNGKCAVQSGQCECRPAWKGRRCE